MVTNKERMLEWLNRAADDVYEARRKPRWSKDKKLTFVRQSYSIINVLTMVANGEAYMIGIAPPSDIKE